MTGPHQVPGPDDPGLSDEQRDGPIIRDKRRIDPVTGEVRQPDPGVASPAEQPNLRRDADVMVGSSGRSSDDPGRSDIERTLEERTADLQRVTAEYANYRKRVDRDRQAVAEQALASVLVGLLPVLDDIERARSHGELEGGFRSVADNLETTLSKLGLERFGLAGEPFDPTVHEALTHAYSSEVEDTTCGEIFQSGYRLGDRVLRPARVAVVEPESPAASATQPATE